MKDLANDKNYPLLFSNETLSVVGRLSTLPRTGWVQWNVQNPETVWEHIIATRELAIQYRDILHLQEEELVDLLNIIEIHDWPEALVGDGVILGDEQNVQELRNAKQRREFLAMQEICADHPQGKEILTLYSRYMNGSDKIARLAKQLEKLQAVYKAFEYEQTQDKHGLTAEFIHYTKDLIHDESLQNKFTTFASSIPLVLLSSYISLSTIYPI